jgi:hypothetical protein
MMMRGSLGSFAKVAAALSWSSMLVPSLWLLLSSPSPAPPSLPPRMHPVVATAAGPASHLPGAILVLVVHPPMQHRFNDDGHPQKHRGYYDSSSAVVMTDDNVLNDDGHGGGCPALLSVQVVLM